MLIRLNREIIIEYIKRVRQLELVNEFTRKLWEEDLKIGFKKKDRVKIFNVIAYVEDWESRGKKFNKRGKK